MSRSMLKNRAICLAATYLAAAALLMCFVMMPVHGVAQDNKFRSLSGVVFDQHHEPLKGAVVEVQDEDSKSVISYLTDSQGHYDFKRLNAGADFTFWATYRGHRSKTHNLGKFNSKTNDVVEIEIKLD